jgi:hypothetical protein
MATKYPAQIDTTTNLPTQVDDSSAVTGKSVNDLRDTILRIETELGVKPSGTYGTVRARLDALEALIGSGSGGVHLGGDLGGTNNTPRVIGLRGIPISSISPIPGQVLGFDGLAWTPVNGGGGPGVTFDVSLFGLNFVEVGEIVNGPVFTAMYNNTPVSATLTDNFYNVPLDVSATPYLFSSNEGFLMNTAGASVIFTLTASDGAHNGTDTNVLIWVEKIYYGVGAPGQSSASFIKNLPGVLSGTQLESFTVNPTSSEKIYYAFRTGMTVPTFYFNGFSGGFTLVSTTIAVTNTFGITENYTLYESDNIGLGLTTVYLL